MSNSPASNTKFWIISILVLGLSAVGAAALWPLAVAAAEGESTRLVGEAAVSSPATAAADYRLAAILDPANTAAFTGYAHSLLTQDQPEDALAVLDRAGEGTAVSQLRTRALLELGRYNEATDASVDLTAGAAGDESLVLAVLANSVAGHTAAAEALIPRLTSPQALQTARRAQASQFTLAQELNATGLVRSASAMLVKLTPSYECNLLLAQIQYANGSKNDLVSAASNLTMAITLNPSSVEARQLLAKVYIAEKKPLDAAKENDFINKLQTGHP